VLKQALLRATGPVLTAGSFQSPVSARIAEPRAEANGPFGGAARSPIEAFLRQSLHDCGQDLYQHVHRHVDQQLLPLVLQSTGGNQVRAAQLLGITRRTLRLRLRELGLAVTKTIEEVDEID
jgi:DNA-binding protein Fis